MDSLKLDWLFLLSVIVVVSALLLASYKLIDFVLYELRLRKRRSGKSDLKIRSNS